MTTKKTKKNEVKPNVTTTVSQNDVYVTLEQTGSNISIKTSSLSEIKDLNEVGNGMVLMKYLVMVGRADNLAQNEKMTGDSLKLLDNIDNMLYYMQHEKNK